MKPMRTASILLALIVVLGLAREVAAESGAVYVEHAFVLTFGDQWFGFLDLTHSSGAPPEYRSILHLGPLGSPEVTFTAVQGLVGFGCIVATLITLAVVFTVRWERKPGSPAKLRISRRRLRLRFSLRAIFIAITLLAIWLGYHVNWIRQRHAALKWLDQHSDTDSTFVGEEWILLPWSLKLLGEPPLTSRFVGPNDEELRDLTPYRQQLAEISALFPECEFFDRSPGDQ